MKCIKLQIIANKKKYNSIVNSEAVPSPLLANILPETKSYVCDEELYCAIHSPW